MYPPIRAIGIVANCTYHPQHNWRWVKRRKDTPKSSCMYRVFRNIRHELLACILYVHVHVGVRRCQNSAQETANAVILKGFNDRKWKFILRSGYERLIRDKLPLAGAPVSEMYKTCSVAKRDALQNKTAALSMRNKNRTLNASVLDLILCA